MKEKMNGDKMLFITATHGNEAFSIDVLDRIVAKLSPDQYGYDTIFGNPRALEKDVRYVDADLNRVAPGDASSNIYEERRAAQIMELSKQYKFIIDIHGTVADCGIVTIIPYPTMPNLLLAAMLPIERNVIWYAKSSIERGPLVQFTSCPGIEIECGPKTSEQIQADLEALLATFLETRADASLDDLIETVKGKAFYNVYGQLNGDSDNLQDFVPITIDDETFYPFLSNNQYPGISCYKMEKIRIENLLLI